MSMSPADLKGLVGGEPTWEIVQLFPPQGEWSEGDYLALTTNRLVELSEGRLEFPAMLTEEHQDIAGYLYRMLFTWVATCQAGKVHFAQLRVRLWQGKFREPDVAFMLARNAERRRNAAWQGADLAMEVVSESDPDRDWVHKREEYARAAISEYWIADPRDQPITVLTLDAAAREYIVAGRYARGEQAASILLPGFTIDVEQAFTQT